MRNQTLKRNERLRSKKAITALFGTGKHFFVYPFKVVYDFPHDETDTLQLLVTVSRRNHKKAVDRNHIKRLMREAWRKNKESLADILKGKDEKCRVGLIYTAKEVLPFAKIDGKIILILQRLIQVNEDRQTTSA
jgi:ribonuclease P protein component